MAMIEANNNANGTKTLFSNMNSGNFKYQLNFNQQQPNDSLLLSNQITNFCPQISTYLNNKINFKSEKDFKNENNDQNDDDYVSSIEKLKKKYTVLTAKPINHSSSHNNNNGNSTITKFNTNDNKTLSLKRNITTKNDSNDNDNEMKRPKLVLFSAEKIRLEWPRISSIGCGLENLGNTCYINSVLQVLTYCPPLVNYLINYHDDHLNHCNSTFCMICLMYKHVTTTLNSKLSVVRPNYICSRLKSIANHFSIGRQEDAHEFLRYIINKMDKSCLSCHQRQYGHTKDYDDVTKSTSGINQIFGGYHRSQVICMHCKKPRNKYDFFMDFMLDIHNVSSLEQALQNFVNPEFLRNENAYKCKTCEKFVVAKKQFTVYREPNVATFQLKRFDLNRSFTNKLVKFVSYPEILNLRPYMSEKGPPIHYKLMSVLIHHGMTCSSGHYYCFVRNSNNCWYRMDDSSVSQVGLNEVLHQKAYILFYVRQRSDQSAVQKKPIPSDNLNVFKNIKINNSNNNFNCHNGKNNNNSSMVTIKDNGVVMIQKAQSLNNDINSSKNVSEINDKTPKTSVTNSVNKSTLTSPALRLPTVTISSKSDTSIKNDVDQVKTSSKISSTNNNSISNNHSNKNGISILKPKSTLSTPINEPKIAIKVKATTNSWKVVETVPVISPQSSSSLNNESKNDSNSSNSSSPPTTKSINESIKMINANWKISKTIDEDTGDATANQISTSTANVNGYSAAISALKKKKKKKKDKSRKRKHMNDDDNADNCNDDDDDLELNWVERTKETLELENGLDRTLNEHKRLKNGSSSSSDADSKSNVLDVLLKNVSNGYGDVKSWNGGVSILQKSIEKDRQNLLNSNDQDDDDDLYNEEFDQGKAKKIRNKIDTFSRQPNGVNLFQAKYQQLQHKKNNHHHHSNSSSSSMKSKRFNSSTLNHHHHGKSHNHHHHNHNNNHNNHRHHHHHHGNNNNKHQYRQNKSSSSTSSSSSSSSMHQFNKYR